MDPVKFYFRRMISHLEYVSILLFDPHKYYKSELQVRKSVMCKIF